MSASSDGSFHRGYDAGEASGTSSRTVDRVPEVPTPAAPRLQTSITAATYVGYVAFVVCYGFLISVGGAFGVFDDGAFLESLLVGKRLPFFIDPSIGRF